MLACANLTKKYDKTPLFSDVSLSVQPGECVCVIGPAASGKLAMLRMMLGIEEPTSGHVEVDGVDLRTLPAPILQLYRTRVGVVFQDPQLLKHLTVAENVAYPLEMRGMLKNSWNAVPDMLRTVGLAAKATMLPSALSASERMMTSIARALATSPMIVLADDPFSPLDPMQRGIALALFTEANKRGASVLIFTQDATVAQRMNARVVMLQEMKAAPASTQAPTR